MIYNLTNKHIMRNGFWHRIKRYFCAKPVLCFDASIYTLSYKWSNGLIEVVEQGHFEDGELIKVPRNTEVYYEFTSIKS